MTFRFSIDDLLAWTEWDRGQWHAWFREQGPSAFAVGLGPHVDGRMTTVGELVRHIFSAEQRYVERIRGTPLTDTSGIPANDVEQVFDFGRQSREQLRELLASFPADRWDIPQLVEMGKYTRTITPRKMVVQAVTHEIRHWAQVATFLRLDGRPSGMHDVLVSPLYEDGV